MTLTALLGALLLMRELDRIEFNTFMRVRPEVLKPQVSLHD